MDIIGIIPARWASTRFPGKPLVRIGKKTMIERVYEQSAKVLKYVIVATDDQRIVDEVNRFGGQVVMTGTHHKSGTDRCYEALTVYEKQTGLSFGSAINIQGDEPFIQPEQILSIVDCFNNPGTQIATLIKKITSKESLFNPNNPKVVITNDFDAIYFSRSIIPYVMNEEQENWLNKYTFYEHLGLYGYKKEILYKLTALKPSALEMAESLEQNRWLENGFKIKVALTEHENISIDTIDDLNAILQQGGFD